MSSPRPDLQPDPHPGPRRRLPALLLGLLGLLSTGCGGSSDGTGGDSAETVAAADVTVLMMGNSHTTVANLPAQLGALLRAGLPDKTVAVAVAPGWMFLDERVDHRASLDLLHSRTWNAVVLQAQKYSTSGLFSYPTLGAELLVQAARGQQAVPVLFPEWPRRGVAETARIYDLHVAIATAQPACVAPVGQAWDLALQRDPALRLHGSDGNHADVPGAFLAALVLYAGITGASPRTLPDIDNGVAPAVQAQLRAAAADTLDAVPARRHCPADALLARPAHPHEGH